MKRVYKIYPLLAFTFLVLVAARCRYGCTDPNALNYEERAARNDGSCIYEGQFGCIDPKANNFSAKAYVEDGSCSYDVEDFVGQYWTTERLTEVATGQVDTMRYVIEMYPSREEPHRLIIYGLGARVPVGTACWAGVTDSILRVPAQFSHGDTSWGRTQYTRSKFVFTSDTTVEYSYHLFDKYDQEYEAVGTAVFSTF